MYKLFTIFLLQATLILSLHAQESKEVKSDLLRAIHQSDSNEVRAIAKSQKSVISSDPILESMVKAYFAAEKRALQELKEKAKLQREEDVLQLEQAKLAKILEEQKLAEEKRAKILEVSEMAAKKPENGTPENATVAAKKKEVKKSVMPKPVKQPKVTKADLAKSKPAPKKTIKTVQEITKHTAKPHKIKKSKIHMSKVDIAGKWVADKKEKNVTFKVYDNNTFVLEERNDRGTLLLEGTYEYEDEQLMLEIHKITYNVRSREAAVQRIYQLKSVSSKKLILLDEKGEVAYSFRR